ncbi:MAG TPA: oligopeptide:H+ symporter [Anaeromyxobacteraceae bacterium]|nr:oligopeptide:H+ symporter [Anaeromyxobacteraceae bacterium]
MSVAAAPAPSRKIAFSTIFLVEMWERFGYYGMTAVVLLYMVQKLGYTDERASLTFGAFTALVYAAPSVGGWLGDRVLGSRRMTVIGALVLALGYVLLAIPGGPLFPALGVVAVGNGLFKANPANLVSKIYEGEPSKIDGAFTLYYMSVNVGATMSQLATPLIAIWAGWNVAFGVCAAGMLLAVVNYLVMRRHLAHVGSPPDFAPLQARKLLLVLLGAAAAAAFVTVVVQDLRLARMVVWGATAALVVIFGLLVARGNPAERRGLVAVGILTAQTIVFFVFYQQMSTSLTLFALRNVDLRFLFGYEIPPAQLQALNPLWIFVLSPLVAWSYGRMAAGRGDLSIAAKFALGFAVLAVGFLAFGISGRFAVDGKVSVWWMIAGYGLYSLGEILISGLGLAMVARYVGPKLRGFVMGIWFLATGISQYLGSYVATFASVPADVSDPVMTLPLYVNLFLGLGLVATVGTGVALALLPLMRRLSEGAAGATQAAK